MGWAQYFSYGTLTKAYRAVDWLVQRRLRWVALSQAQGPGERNTTVPD